MKISQKYPLIAFIFGIFRYFCEIFSQNSLNMMILEFTIGNFLSFRDNKTLSMEATKIKEFPNNVVNNGKYKLLRSAVIYGANSSGKSNLIKALQFMLETIKNSSKLNSTDELCVTPFALNKDTAQKPSYFELLFVINKVRYRYGFEIDTKKIYSEWLYVLPHESKLTKDMLLFARDNQEIVIAEEFNEGKGLAEKNRENGLFLSVCDQFNGEISKKIISNLNFINLPSGIDHAKSSIMTSIFMENLEADTKEFFKNMQLGFTDIIMSPENKIKALTIHNLYNKKGEIVGDYKFKILESESAGTNKLFDLAGFILFGLKFGKPVVIDELDAKLHPILTHKIIELFNSPETNKLNAQLIFATHDTNLLGCSCFRRDQIWFTEKDTTESTDLYSLVEFKEPDGTKVRNDRSFEKDYITGRYGAIPFIGDFSNLFNHGQEED